MSLRDIANDDLKEIINDTETGGDIATITSPAGVPLPFRVLSNDIHLSIDEETGQAVTGRQSTIAVLINELIAASFDGIRGVAATDSKPWVVDTTDVNGVAGKFKVAESVPDNGAGLMVLILEVYSA